MSQVDNAMMVNDLEIPEALSDAIASGKWMALSSSPELTRLFSSAGIVQPTFYDESALARENAGWSQESDPEYLGEKSAASPPGDIDPTQSVLVADLGPDRPIALDYRASNSPRVVRLADGSDESGWIEVVSDVEAFIKILSGEVE